jgi:hypothetical protein
MIIAEVANRWRGNKIGKYGDPVGIGETLSENTGTRIDDMNFRYGIGIYIIDRYRPILDIYEETSDA